MTEAHAKVWADDLGGIGFLEAVEALKLHSQESDKWVLPSHIIANVRRVRDRQLREARRRLPLPAPNVVTFDRAEYDRAVAAAIAGRAS